MPCGLVRNLHSECGTNVKKALTSSEGHTWLHMGDALKKYSIMYNI